jgi:hypothetical protein
VASKRQTAARLQRLLDALLDVVAQHREDFAHARVELLLEEQRGVLSGDLAEAALAGGAAVDARVAAVRAAGQRAAAEHRPAAARGAHEGRAAACAGGGVRG